MKEKIDFFSFAWGKKGAIDPWSIVHILWGAVFAILFSVFGWSFKAALIVTVVSLIVWEVFEYAVDMLEPMPNVIADIIVGIVGFWVSFTYLPQEGNIRFLILAILVTLAIVLGYTGWRKWVNRQQNLG